MVPIEIFMSKLLSDLNNLQRMLLIFIYNIIGYSVM